MTETKAAPVETDDTEDGELAAIAQSVSAFDETALRNMYLEKGFSEKEADAFLAPMRQTNETNKKLLARDQRKDREGFVSALKEQYPYAFDADGKPLFSGVTKSEMKHAAEKLHAHTASLVGASRTAGEKKPAATDAGAPDARAEDWGNPPAGSGETVVDRGGTFASWEGQRGKAVHGKANDIDAIKDDIKADLKANGPRPMRRRSIGQIIGRVSDEAAARAAKT